MWLIFDIVIVVPFVGLAKLIGVLNFSLLFLVLINTRALLQHGLMRQASLVYLAGTWLVTTDIIVLSGTIHSPALVFYIALPISAAWLLGFRAALWTAAACLSCSLAMALLETAGV